jgi:hypothetical protein
MGPLKDWKGITTAAIRGLMGAMIQPGHSTAFKIESFAVRPSSTPGIESVNSTLQLSASISAHSKVTGNIFAQYEFVYVNGEWKILQETWAYKTLDTGLVGVKTTLP